MIKTYLYNNSLYNPYERLGLKKGNLADYRGCAKKVWAEFFYEELGKFRSNLGKSNLGKELKEEVDEIFEFLSFYFKEGKDIDFAREIFRKMEEGFLGVCSVGKQFKGFFEDYLEEVKKLEKNLVNVLEFYRESLVAEYGYVLFSLASDFHRPRVYITRNHMFDYVKAKQALGCDSKVVAVDYVRILENKVGSLEQMKQRMFDILKTYEEAAKKSESEKIELKRDEAYDKLVKDLWVKGGYGDDKLKANKLFVNIFDFVEKADFDLEDVLKELREFEVVLGLDSENGIGIDKVMLLDESEKRELFELYEKCKFLSKLLEDNVKVLESFSYGLFKCFLFDTNELTLLYKALNLIREDIEKANEFIKKFGNLDKFLNQIQGVSQEMEEEVKKVSQESVSQGDVSQDVGKIVDKIDEKVEKEGRKEVRNIQRKRSRIMLGS